MSSTSVFLCKLSAILLAACNTVPAQTAGAPSDAGCRRVDAAVRWRSTNRTYLFSGEEVVVYNDKHSAEETVTDIGTLARNFPRHVDAAVAWFKKDSSFYFKGCYGYLINERKKTTKRKKLKRYGIPCDVDAAQRVNANTIWIFKGCRYWHLTRRNLTATEVGDIRALGLPCPVDAAVGWNDDSIRVIKDDVIWTLSSAGQAGGRKLLDDWNLCSWNICRSSFRPGGQQTQASDVTLSCNGDKRFCHLNFDQVTLAGSHNSGSGFDGGFGFLDCWVRNQALSVLDQLRLGIRFLDVDSSWQHCGLLGAYHGFLCGGPVCKLLKQLKQFLEENRQEVVAINFNHEMKDADTVLPVLLRQVTSQLGSYLNTVYRSHGQWPSLRQAVVSDKRLFVFIDRRVQRLPGYATSTWIHSEDLLKSTWRADTTVSAGNCQKVLQAAGSQCREKSSAPLLEVPVLGSSTMCVSRVAQACLPLVHTTSRACAQHRHPQNKAPNVLLVDYPETATSDSESVMSAAFHQNLRNLARLLPDVCQVTVDAAVWDGATADRRRVYFFSGPRVLTYNWETSTQTSVETAADFGLPSKIDAVYLSSGESSVCITNGCDVTCRETLSSGSVTMKNLTDMGLPCDLDAAFSRSEAMFFFKGCEYWKTSGKNHVTGPQPITDFGLPCNITAALLDADGTTYFFKGGNYWRFSEKHGLSAPADTLDSWSLDLVHCRS